MFPKIFCALKNFWSENVPKFVEPTEFWVPKNSWAPNNFGPPKNFGLKNV